MDLGLTGHVALVQGASKGIGRGIAEALAAEGCDLMLTARNEAALAATAAQIATTSGRRVLHQAADSSDHSAMDSVVDRVQAELGRLDIIVCNSGGPPPGGIRELTDDQWRAACDLLLVGPVHLLRRGLPMLAKSPAPRFFVVTSSSTREPVMGLTLSNTIRPGVVGLIKTLAQELAPERICCHSLAPGRIDTDRLGNVARMQASKLGKTEQEVFAGMIAAIPAGRLGSTADMGSVAAFLSSPRASYLTGMNWLIDGGLIKSI